MERYTDQVRINIRLHDNGLPEEPSEEWFVIASTGGLVDRDAITANVLTQLAPDNYTLDERHHRTSWGASAEIFELVLAMSGGAGGTLIASGVTAAARSLRDKLRKAESPPLTDGQAVHAVRQILCRRYEFDSADFVLNLVEIDTEECRGRVVMTAPDNAVHTVELKQHKGRVTLAKSIRAAP